MFIKKLELTDYRNYSKQCFEFSDGINIICGDNAQGKTNCAEAIFYLCTGYSPRAAKDKQVIGYGKQKSEISGTAVSRYGNVNVSVDFYSDANKNIKINGVQVLKIGELLGNINSVFFNPGQLKLIQESPEDRRRFLDISLSQMSKRYFYSLQRYKKILSQRNNLLKNTDTELIYDTLPIWDLQLCKEASAIIAARNDYVKILSPLAKDAHSFITDKKEDLEILFDWKYEGTEEEIAAAFAADLKEKIEKDIILGYTTVGPHRDDLKIKINGEDVRTYGSQGQQRTAALSLKLAELEIFKKHFGEYPVLILDDAMSELDASRRQNLIDRIKGIQTIVTCTSVDEEIFKDRNYKKFIISDGKVISTAEI